MAKTSAERYMEWLTRKEEELGVGAVQRLLGEFEELGSVMSAQADRLVETHEVVRFMEFGRARYEVMPEIGITTFWAPHPGGRHISYLDIERKRIISYAETTTRIKEYWEEWGY